MCSIHCISKLSWSSLIVLLQSKRLDIRDVEQTKTDEQEDEYITTEVKLTITTHNKSKEMSHLLQESRFSVLYLPLCVTEPLRRCNNIPNKLMDTAWTLQNPNIDKSNLCQTIRMKTWRKKPYDWKYENLHTNIHDKIRVKGNIYDIWFDVSI